MDTAGGRIEFHLQSKSFRLTGRKVISGWIKQVADNQGFVIGDINVIFVSESKLLKMNQLHLKHRDHTDIITFDYTEANILSGDLFISYNRVKENATKFNTTFSDEILRVIIHGVLHLIGYTDKTLAARKEMRAKEDECLSLYYERFHVKH